MAVRSSSRFAWRLAWLLSVSSCSCDEHRSPSPTPDDNDSGSVLVCEKGKVKCDNGVAKTCDGKGGFSRTDDCTARGQHCLGATLSVDGELQTLACVSCSPGEASCSGGSAKLCRKDGSGFDSFECDVKQGMVCEADGCKGGCAPPEVSASYIGCDYYPTVTLNPVWSGFDFAVTVSNASDATAHVIVTRGDELIRELDISKGALETIKLDWVSALKGGDQNACQVPPEPGDTRLVKAGAYRIRSNRPVTVYQFSPLQYQLGTADNPPAQCPVGTMCLLQAGCSLASPPPS